MKIHIIIFLLALLSLNSKSQNLCDAKMCLNEIFLHTNIKDYLIDSSDLDLTRELYVSSCYIVNENGDSLLLDKVFGSLCSIKNITTEQKMLIEPFYLVFDDFKIGKDTASVFFYTNSFVMSTLKIAFYGSATFKKLNDTWVITNYKIKNGKYYSPKDTDFSKLEDNEIIQLYKSRAQNRMNARANAKLDNSLNHCSCSE
jgi:hypothetical protein